MPKFELERSIAIKAPAASVFSNVRDFCNWPDWSPWILAEPKCEISYAEDGESYRWAGDIIGAGEMEVLRVIDNREIHYRLTFLKPFKSTSSVSFYFEESNGETNTRWTMSGGLPFFLFWMKKMMVAAIGMDYDRGLRMLKDQVELGCIPSTLKFSGFDTVAGFDYLGLRRDCDFLEVPNLMSEDMKKLRETMQRSGIEAVGRPVSFYDKFDLSKGTTSYTVALPVASGTPCPSGLVAGTLPTLKCYAIHHTGPYRHLGNPWAAGMMHQRAKLYSLNKANVPFEVYQNNPCDVEEGDLRTSVYFPAK